VLDIYHLTSITTTKMRKAATDMNGASCRGLGRTAVSLITRMIEVLFPESHKNL